MHDISHESAAERLRFLILALQRQGNRELSKFLVPLGLTTSQAEALEVVGSYGPLTTAQVGSLLVCESGSPSRLLKTLADKGLTIRSTPVDNRRATLHVLTPAGQIMLGKVREATGRFHAEIASRQPTDFSALELNELLTTLSHFLVDEQLLAALHQRFPDWLEIG